MRRSRLDRAKAIADCREAVLRVLSDADELLANVDIARRTGFRPLEVANALRWLSEQGLARLEVERMRGARRARWMHARVVPIFPDGAALRRRVGHMLPEDGERFERCVHFSDCLRLMAMANHEFARCPRDCTHRSEPAPGSELLEITERRRAWD